MFEKISEAEIPSSIKKTASFQQFLLSVHFIKLDSEKETVKCKSQLKYFQSSFDKGNMTVVQNWVFLVKSEPNFQGQSGFWSSNMEVVRN